MESIKIVQVKHPNCGYTYTFMVPETAFLRPGDWVLCETKKNPMEIGRCITPAFFVTEYQLESLYGMKSNNLKPIVGRLEPEMFIVKRRVEE